MSYASDALLRETANKVAELEKKLGPQPETNHEERITKLEGELRALKARMGKQKE